MTVDFPDPDAPTTNTNSPLSMCERDAVESGHAGVVDLLHALEDDHRGAGCIRLGGSLTGELLGLGEGRHRSLQASRPAPGRGAAAGTGCSGSVGSADYSGHIPRPYDLPRRLGEEVGVDEPVERAVEHGLCVAGLVVGVVVLYELVRVEHVGADLTAEADVLRHAPLLRELRLPLLLLQLGEARAEDAERGLLVRRLGALVLALDDGPGREVGDADRGVGLFTCCPPAPVARYVSILEVASSISTSMSSGRSAPRRPGRTPCRRCEASNGEAYEAGGRRALGLRGRRTRSRRGRRRWSTWRPTSPALASDLPSRTPVGRPAEVHAEQHLGPVLRVGAAGTRMDLEDGVALSYWFA